MSNRSTLLLVIVCLIIGACGGWLYGRSQNNPAASPNGVGKETEEIEDDLSRIPLSGATQDTRNDAPSDRVDMQRSEVATTDSEISTLQELDSNAAMILSSEVTAEKCQIKLETTSGTRYLETQYLEYDAGSRCYQFVLNVVAPSGKYAAYEDISGGMDSAVQLYSVQHDARVLLDVLGSSAIFDVRFLPDDRVVVMYGYRESYDEQYLKIYNVVALFSDYPENMDPEYPNSLKLNTYSKTTTLPNVSADYYRLEVVGDKLYCYGAGGLNSQPLMTYSLSEI